MSFIHISYLGHAAFRFTSDQGTVIYFDPWFEGNPLATLGVEDIDRADLVVVSHGHDDHCHDAFSLVKKTGAKFSVK